MTQLDRLEALAPEWEEHHGSHISLALLDALPDLIRVARATWLIGWNDNDGKCWCLEATVVTGFPHSEQCSALRETLAPLLAEVES